jgi:hypothetical protein
VLLEKLHHVATSADEENRRYGRAVTYKTIEILRRTCAKFFLSRTSTRTVNAVSQRHIYARTCAVHRTRARAPAVCCRLQDTPGSTSGGVFPCYSRRVRQKSLRRTPIVGRRSAERRLSVRAKYINRPPIYGNDMHSSRTPTITTIIITLRRPSRVTHPLPPINLFGFHAECMRNPLIITRVRLTCHGQLTDGGRPFVAQYAYLRATYARGYASSSARLNRSRTHVVSRRLRARNPCQVEPMTRDDEQRRFKN